MRRLEKLKRTLSEQLERDRDRLENRNKALLDKQAKLRSLSVGSANGIDLIFRVAELS